MENRFLSPAARALSDWTQLPKEMPEGVLDLPLVDGHTPLTQAVCAGDTHRMAMLLKRGANANVCDARGVPPIVYAAAKARGEMAAQLLHHGAAPDMADANGRVAAHYAFYRGRYSLIEMLQSAGADFNLVDSEGRSVIDFARARHDDKDVVAARTLSSMAEKLAKRRASSMHTPDLRGDADFRQLDLATKDQSFEFGILGASTIEGLVVLAPSAVIIFAGGSLILGALALYIVTTFLLMRHFRVLSSDTPGYQPTPPASAALASAGSPLRGVQKIIRATSRAQFAKLDVGLAKPADLKINHLLLLVLGLAAPLTTVLVAIVGAAWVLLAADQLGQFLGEVIPLIVFFLFGVIPGLYIMSWLIVAPFRIYAWGARRLLRQRILARQSALSQHINMSTDLRQGGQFAEGGIVYLRSFDFDGSFVIDGMDFELLMLTLFHAHANVFALNAEDGSQGTVNLKTNDTDWKQLAEDMIERAGQVIMIPADSQGVLDEIEMLRAGGWFAKTLFVAPPNSQSRDTAADWERMRLRPELRELELPPYCSAGFLFRLGPHGALQEYGPLGIDVSPMPLWLLVKNQPPQAVDDADEIEAISDTTSGRDTGLSSDASTGNVASSSSSEPAAAGATAATAASVAAVGLVAYQEAVSGMDATPIMTSEAFIAEAGISDIAEVEGFDGVGDFSDGSGGDGGG